MIQMHTHSNHLSGKTKRFQESSIIYAFEKKQKKKHTGTQNLKHFNRAFLHSDFKINLLMLIYFLFI